MSRVGNPDPATPQHGFKTVLVDSGATLWGVAMAEAKAKAHGQPVSNADVEKELKTVIEPENKQIKDPDKIWVGDQIVVPEDFQPGTATHTSPTPTASPTTASAASPSGTKGLAKGQVIEAGHGVVDGNYYLELNSNGDLALYPLNAQTLINSARPIWSYSPGVTASSVTWDGKEFVFTAKNSPVKASVQPKDIPANPPYLPPKPVVNGGTLTFVQS